MTIDTHAARQVVFVSAGETFTYEPSDGSDMITTVVDSTGVALGPPKPDLPFMAIYTCTPGQSFTFYKTAVHFVIDGPKVSLTAGNSNS